MITKSDQTVPKRNGTLQTLIKYNKLTPTLKYTRIKSGFKNFGSFDAKTPQVKTKLF